MESDQSKRSRAMKLASIGFWCCQIPHGRLEWSPEILAILGLPDSVQPGFSALETLVEPADLARFQGLVIKTLSGDPRFRVPLRIQRPDGKRREIHVVGQTDFDSQGNALESFGTIQDITRLSRADPQEPANWQSLLLQRAEERAHIGHWTFELPSLALLWSTEVYRIHGLDPKTYTPTVESAIECYLPDDRPTIATAVQNAIDSGAGFELELRIARPDGSIRHVQARGDCKLGSNGQTERVYGIFQDITEIKRTEIELRQAKEKAEESDRLKSAFLANVSHEIRTPLNAILGFSQIMKSVDVGREERDRYIEIIDASGKHLLQLVGDIIDLAQLDSGQLSLQPHRFDLNHMMLEAYSVINGEIQRREKEAVNLVLETSTLEPKPVLADETRVRQILYNLLTNALKYTPTGEIRFGYREPAADQIEFYVTDTGIGIDPSLHQSIFQRFHQADNDMTRTHDGAGLGLSICHGLVKLLGGRIWLESSPGAGSTFHFQIQIDSDPQTVPPEPPLPDEAIQYPVCPPGTTVLIAEDERMNYLVLSSILKPRKLRLLWAQDGDEAIEFCRSDAAIDLVLMDLKMPKTDGLTATRAIKRLRPELPILAQTAYAMPDDQDLAAEAGCDGYITKPIDAHTLLELIDRHLCGQS